MVYDRIVAELSRVLEVEPDVITPDTDIIKDLGADSLDVVELIMLLEDEYGIVVLDDDAAELHTVGEISAMIEKLVK